MVYFARDDPRWYRGDGEARKPELWHYEHLGGTWGKRLDFSNTTHATRQRAGKRWYCSPKIDRKCDTS